MAKDFITEQELLDKLNTASTKGHTLSTSLPIGKLKLFAKNTRVRDLKIVLNQLIHEFPNVSTGEIIKNMVESKGLKPKEIISRAGVSKDYYSKIIADKRKPSRTKTLQLCFGLGLSPEEANGFLKKMGHNELYLRNEFDFILYAALARNLTYFEVEDLLDSLGYDPLVKE